METEMDASFIDAESGRPLDRSRLAIGTVLEWIDSPPTIFIQGELWELEHAEPATAGELETSGAVRLNLRRQAPVATTASPESVHFSKVSICEALPPMTGRPMVMNAPYLRLDEHDWRGTEFVADTAQSAITRTFAEIAAVMGEGAHREGAGFGRCVMRAEPAAPLAGISLSVDELAAVLDVDAAGAYPVAIAAPSAGHQLPNGIVQGGFAFPVGSAGTCVYGRNDHGLIVELAVHRPPAGDPDPAQAAAVADALAILIRSHGLSLVDWRACAQLRTSGQIAAWLGRS